VTVSDSVSAGRPPVEGWYATAPPHAVSISALMIPPWAMPRVFACAGTTVHSTMACPSLRSTRSNPSKSAKGETRTGFAAVAASQPLPSVCWEGPGMEASV
jgi:hypothetical protein